MSLPEVYDDPWIKSLDLTAREVDVLACLLEYQASKKIATVLNVRAKTVDAHLFNVMQKTDKHSRSSLVEYMKQSPCNQRLSNHRVVLLQTFRFTTFLSKIGQTIHFGNKNYYLVCPHVGLKKKLEHDLKTLGLYSSSSKKEAKIVQVKLGDDYYQTFFDALSQIETHPLIGEALAYFAHCLPPEASAVPNFFRKEELSTKKVLLLIFLIVMTIGIVGSTIFLIVHTKSPIVRSDCPIPIKAKCLDRTHLLSKIDSLFPKKEPIEIAALVGIGGAGKTVLARTYARQQKYPVVWEINAETKETLTHSFSNLAYALARTPDEKAELERIKQTEKQQDYIQKLLFFVKQHLLRQKEWFLIFDNVEKMAEIRSFLPTDPTTWGRGKILITSRDSTILNQGAVTKSQVLVVEELTPQEKLTLFLKVREHENEDRSKLSSFLKFIPPFPLDVSVAAYHIKGTHNSFDEYLKCLEAKNENILPPTDTSNYDKTRHQIIACSVDQMLAKRKEFAGLLFLLCVVDSQDVPKSLLEKHCDLAIVELFIQHMAQASLLTYRDTTKTAVLSMHRSIQKNILDYLQHITPVEKQKIYLYQILKTFEDYTQPMIENIDIPKMRDFSRHLVAVLNKKILVDSDVRAFLQSVLGILYCEQGDYVTAQQLLEESYTHLIRSTQSLFHARVLRAMTYMGIVERTLGNHKLAKVLLEKSTRLYDKISTSNKFEHATALCHLAYVYQLTDGFEKTKETIEKAINLYLTHSGKSLGYALAIADLAACYFNVGDYSKSKEYRENSLLLTKKLCGNSHVKVFLINGLLGMDYKGLGNYNKALTTLMDSYVGIKKYYPDHFSLLSATLGRIGDTYRLLGLSKQAEEFLKQSIQISGNYFGPEHVHTDRHVICLSQLYTELGYYRRAEELLTGVLERYASHFGIDHEKTVFVLNQLALVYTELGHYQKAKIYFEKSLTLYAKKYGKNHVDYAIPLKELGRFYTLTKDFNTAELLLKKALFILEKNNHPECFRCLEYLGDLFEKQAKLSHTSQKEYQQQNEKAYDFYQKALIIVRRQFPNESVYTGRIKEKMNILIRFKKQRSGFKKQGGR